MPFIKLRKMVYDSDGAIVSGSAALCDTQYIPGQKYHSRQIIRERLGKVLWISEDRRTGIFLSPERGLIQYSANSDTFSEVKRTDERLPKEELFPQPPVHTIFGDVFFIYSYLQNSPLLEALKEAFFSKKDLERVLIHLFYTISRDGSHIHCDDFMRRSFLSRIFTNIPLSSLRSDTIYFKMLGDDETKLAFFKSYVKVMRKINPDFGKGCYVDSTPLPNDIDDNPFNALCCHGVGSSTVQTRLVLVLDEATDLPVWYSVIPGNVIDLNTIINVMEDVKTTLDIEISSLVLDAGYASKEIIRAYHIGTKKKIIVRCPFKRGYGADTAYKRVKSMIFKGKYSFVRNRHVYFGHRIETQLFGEPVYYYIYVDKNNALQRQRDNLLKNVDRFGKLCNEDKDWEEVKGGFFILISNQEMKPKDLLDRYFDRVDIEMTFRTIKEYLALLPLSKWTDQTVKGKILSDIISLIVYTGIRQKIAPTGESMTTVFGRATSLMCFTDKNGTTHIETPNKQIKDYAKAMELTIPGTLKTSSLVSELLE